MDIVMVLLRVSHILAGVFWAGASFMMAGFITPAITSAGPDGGKVMQALLERTRFSVIMPLAAITTVLCGVLLFWRVSGGLQLDWLASGRGMSLTIGALAGIIAFVEGFTIQKRESANAVVLSKAIQAAGGPPSAAQMGQMRAILGKIARGGQINAVLLIICVLGMGAARYL